MASSGCLLENNRTGFGSGKLSRNFGCLNNGSQKRCGPMAFGPSASSWAFTRERGGRDGDGGSGGVVVGGGGGDVIYRVRAKREATAEA